MKTPSKKAYAVTWIVLVILHFTILGSAYLKLGWANTPLIVALAFVQTGLVLFYFMEIRYSTKVVRVFAAAGFFWLAIQFTLTMSDYLMRQWH
ncbi:MAG TPA: cytochrome C oxidase subunit IV family protein [Desulfuromonadaceae bacterium]|nr:cytochrome C oxidase subunit IV family protein [Desulfuromonadaceae bacterium]